MISQPVPFCGNSWGIMNTCITKRNNNILHSFNQYHYNRISRGTLLYIVLQLFYLCCAYPDAQRYIWKGVTCMLICKVGEIPYTQ